MKYDPNSKVRSQRENMQAFQLRLPKEVIRDLQILRVFGGIKVSEELRDLVIAYVNERRPLLQSVTKGIEVTLQNEEQVEAAEALHKMGFVEASDEKPQRKKK
ncbi:hypothetical protein [Burkholderia anthina]|uniref:hypothetical protein n=1 Tax=Burkholderia anthina TaxID=179879 RepID=UPI001588BFC8|nr:hypothetical protein [Burkholderia anthina]